MSERVNFVAIFDRKRDEEERRKFMLGAERAQDAIFMTNLEGTITYVNPAFERLYGFTRSEAIGKTPRILKSGAQDAHFYKTFWATLVSKQIATVNVVNQTKEGKRVHIEATANPILDARENLLGYLAIHHDVTKQRSLEAQFRHAQKMEAVGRLAGGIAHDFNNVLSVILSYAEMMRETLPEDDPNYSDVIEIGTAARRASDLTRQLLAFSRQQVLQPKIIDLNVAVAAMENMLRRLLGADVELRTEPAAALWMLEADTGQIEQVVMNLAVNARDAMPDGGTLTLSTRNAVVETANDLPIGSYVMLTVRDTGIGMDASTLGRIFEPFFTTKEAGKGTGLGLATVFGIVKQSGGHVTVESEPNEGTTFNIFLPRVNRVADVRVLRRPSTPAPGNETVLVVDDDDQVRTVVRAILQRSGYVVLDAASGEDALAIARGHTGEIALLLADMIMPRMKGHELAARLKSTRPSMHVLFMSGYTNDLLAQTNAYLKKPFTPASLTQTIRDVLSSVVLSTVDTNPTR